MTRLKLLSLAAALALASAAAAQEPVTMDTCEMCHDYVAPVFAAGPHGRAMAKVDSAILDLSCVGCHEDKWNTPNIPSMPMAMKRAPSKLKPEPSGSVPFSFGTAGTISFRMF